MWISYFAARDFRNLAQANVDLGPGLNWLCGPNGMGKTNILEAIYFTLTTKSFRTFRLGDLVGKGSAKAIVRLGLRDGAVTHECCAEIEAGRSRRLLGPKVCSPMDLFRLGPVIAFTARSKSLVEGQPSDRRRFLDRMICHIEPEHLYGLSRYKKVHRQLKQVLLTSKDFGVYRGFKRTALGAARAIVAKRLAFLAEIQPRVQEIYQGVFEGEGTLALEYGMRRCPSLDQYEERMLAACASEILHGRTLLGPHLDDLAIRMVKNRAKTYASSGQVRAIVLSVKLAVRELVYARRKNEPVLLLDDLDAELDMRRIEKLLAFLQDRGQTLISTSKYGTIRPRQEDRIFAVEAGCMNPERMMNDLK